MATFGNRGDKDNDEEGLLKLPLVYAPETKEYKCGWCGQVFVANHTHDDLKKHFQSCKTSKEPAPLMDKRKTNVLYEAEAIILNENIEVGKEIEISKTDLYKEIFNLKSDLRKDLETEKSRETSDADILNKFNILEEKMKNMCADQERKMADVNGRVSGVTETISSVVQSMVEPRLKNETEALWVQLRKNEEEIRAIKSQSETEISHLKRRTEAISEQVKTNDLQVLGKQMEDEQLTIPMNCFNLVAHNYLFQPSFKWTVYGIKNRIAQEPFVLTSEMFQWNGYALKSRVKLRLREDDHVYLSLCLTDECESADLKPFPQVYYLVKDINLRNPQHKCFNFGYLFNSTFKHSLEFERRIGHKPWFTCPPYNIDDSNEIEIYVEPPALTQLVHSYDGTLEWNMENYTRRLQLEIDKLVMYQESPYFYTGPNGYRVNVRIGLYGNEGRRPTARILFWTGKFDDELPESFSHLTTVTLINRKEAERSVSKTIVEDVRNKREYTFDICTGLKMDAMVDNDTLFCKVVIKAQ